MTLNILTDDELAFGWLVLGKGLSREVAQTHIMGASVHRREVWARQQRRALRGFWAWIKGSMRTI